MPTATPLTQALSTPPSPTPKKSKQPLSTVDQAFKLIPQYEYPLIVRKSAMQIQDWLVEDVIRWAKDDPDHLALCILRQLYLPLNSSPNSPPDFDSPNPEYVRLAEALCFNSNRFFKEDPISLAIILMRIAAGRLFFASAQKDVKLVF